MAREKDPQSRAASKAIIISLRTTSFGSTELILGDTGFFNNKKISLSLSKPPKQDKQTKFRNKVDC